MSRRTAAVLAWTLVSVSAVLGLSGTGMSLAVDGLTPHYVFTDGFAIAIFFVSAVVGALIASRYPANPIGWLFVPGFVLFCSSLVAAAVSVVLRFRRARAVERQQLTLLMAAGVVGTAAFIVGGFVGALSGREDLGIAITLLGILSIPVAIGVAMLRYRLYEVDRVVSRTLVYGALTVILGVAYAKPAHVSIWIRAST